MQNYLETEKTSKLLLKFSLPCVLSLLISALYNIVDQIFIGNSNVGAIGNTATTIVFPLTCIALAFGLLIGDGAAAYMSLCQGRKENDKIGRAIFTAISVSVIISIIFIIIAFPLLDNILALFGAKTLASLEKSHEYGFIILIGVPFYIIMNMLNSIIRADGNPKIAMISMVLGAVINVILDAVFIFPLNMGLILVSNIILGIIATLIFQLFPEAIIKMFGSNSKNPDLYIEFGIKAVRIYLMLILFTIIQKVSSIFLQAIGNPIKAIILSLVRDVIAFVPLTILLPLALGINGILWSSVFADIIAIILTAILLLFEVRKMNKMFNTKKT